MFIDANSVEKNSVIEADICIVGAGAAGITLASELAQSDLRIVVLEAGGLNEDALRERDLYALDVVGEPLRDDLPTRRMQLGGSTKAWFGRIGQFDPIDFTQRSWVPHSGWPINEADLAPYWSRAAEILGVPHYDKMANAAWADNPTAQAFNDTRLTTGVFMWAEHADMAAHYHQTLADAPTVRIFLNAQVQSIETKAVAQVTHIMAQSMRRQPFTVKAKQYVLACGGHENARLLLLSRNQMTHGLGNQHDNVGRYLVDHPRSEGVAHIELANNAPATLAKVAMLGEKAPSPYGPVQMQIKFDPSLQEREQLLNHCVHAHLIHAGQELEGWSAAPTAVPT